MHFAGAGHGADALHSVVQYPPLHAVPELVLCAGLQSPVPQSAFATQGPPTSSILPTQLPVATSQVRAVPQLQPCRQSGRHTFAELEQA
jgi:hypothetical protein